MQHSGAISKKNILKFENSPPTSYGLKVWDIALAHQRLNIKYKWHTKGNIRYDIHPYFNIADFFLYFYISIDFQNALIIPDHKVKMFKSPTYRVILWEVLRQIQVPYKILALKYIRFIVLLKNISIFNHRLLFSLDLRLN